MLPELERTSPTPLYQQIQDWMRNQIAYGVWPEHYKLKSETDLAAELGVNRGTIRNAVKALTDSGLLVRIHGRGTFVRSRTIEQPLADHLITFSEGLVLEGISFETRVIEQQTITDTDIKN
jgi:DNA-binding GntR family transcriptional regulator